MNVCPTCGGERRVYSCWDEAKCPMAPLFRDSPENIILPPEFLPSPPEKPE